MSRGHPASPFHSERDSTLAQIRSAYFHRSSHSGLPSAVDQLAALRSRAQSGQDLAIVATGERFPEYYGESDNDDAINNVWRGGEVLPVCHGSVPARPERNFSNTLAGFTRGLVGHSDPSPPVDASR